MVSSACTGGTRTCIQTAGIEYTPEDLQPDTVQQILDNASLVYFDGRLTDSAVQLARAARHKGVPVLVEAERLRGGLDDLLLEADHLCTSALFPKVASNCMSTTSVCTMLRSTLLLARWTKARHPLEITSDLSIEFPFPHIVCMVPMEPVIISQR